MNEVEIKKEVTSWWWNESPFEIYDKMRESLEHYWHFDGSQEQRREDIGRMLAFADTEVERTQGKDDYWHDLAEHLDNSFDGVKEAYDTALEKYEKLEVVK